MLLNARAIILLYCIHLNQCLFCYCWDTNLVYCLFVVGIGTQFVNMINMISCTQPYPPLLKSLFSRLEVPTKNTSNDECDNTTHIFKENCASYTMHYMPMK